ncbi:hypothetical protein AGMMS49545_21540 [Betaproteobacteria bacterium]|nr:hypothetical protein AGMMS49545_21540 [Betaproteobacteria bacterium]GHU40114.1 hypothetical protein AGMMS50289_01190 [Betaproteobacteria bacterium]
MSAFKRSIFILLLENPSVCLYGRTAGEFTQIASFTPDAAGQAELATWLQKNHRLPAVHLLVNLPETAEARDNIPHLRGGERRALLARKLQQQFGGNPFVMATSLGTETVGLRQEENLRLVALPQSVLQGWIAALRDTPIAGIYDVPQLIERLVRQQTCPSVCLILTLHQHALRQTLLFAGRVVFSRLLGRPPETGANWIAEETERLRAYAGRQHFIAADADLAVYLLTQNGLEKWQAAGFDPAVSSVPLLLQTLAQYPPRPQYAPAALRRNHLLPFRRRAAVGVGALILLAGVLWGSGHLADARKQHTRTALLRLDIEQMQNKYRTEASQLPALPTEFDADTARRLLAAYDRQLDAASPEEMLTDLQTLSIWLERHPDIRLEKLQWLAEGRTLMLEGTATPANFARFIRDLTQHDVAHDIQQTPDDDDSPFQLSIHYEGAT